MTNYSHLTNAELIQLLHLRDNLSDLELELLHRLEQALDAVDDLDDDPAGHLSVIDQINHIHGARRAV